MRASCRWCSLNLQLIFSKKHPKLKTNQMWICISLYIFSLLFRSSSLSFSAEMFLRWVSFLSFSIGPQKQGPPTLLIFVGLIDSHHVSVRYDLFIFICLIFVYIYMCIIFAWMNILYKYIHVYAWRLMKGFRGSIQSCKSSNSLPESPCILLSVLRLSIASFTPDLGYLSITLIQLHTVLVVTSTANMLGSIGIAGGVVVGNPYRKICQTLPLRRSRIKNVFVVWAEARGTVFGGISTKHGRPN